MKAGLHYGLRLSDNGFEVQLYFCVRILMFHHISLYFLVIDFPCISTAPSHFQLTLAGFNHKLRILLEIIIQKIANFEVKPDRFSVIKVTILDPAIFLDSLLLIILLNLTGYLSFNRKRSQRHTKITSSGNQITKQSITAHQYYKIRPRHGQRLLMLFLTWKLKIQLSLFQ